MSTYKFDITKRHIAALDDSSAYSSTLAETHADSSVEIAAQQDIDVKIYLDDVEKHSVTLTDAGATLQFDADISQGEHTIRIVPQKDPIQQTDICVDKFYIGDHHCVTSQWDFDNQVLGTASTLRQKLAPHNSVPHDYVWWGRVVNSDSSLNLPGPFYRAGIVSDHQSEWHMDFTKTDDGKIWVSQPGDTDNILWDSTAQHTYYFVQAGNSYSMVQSNWETFRDQKMQSDDSTVSTWQGAGTYTTDSTDVIWLNDSIDQSTENATQVVVLSRTEYDEMAKGFWYHNNHTVTPITVS